MKSVPLQQPAVDVVQGLEETEERRKLHKEKLSNQFS
jgi:hypothetical protein